MIAVFQGVAGLLQWAARVTGLSYNEVNVAVWFGGFPFLVAWLLDCWGRPARPAPWWRLGALVGFMIGWSWLPADLVFDLAVKFLNGFAAVGLDYATASVLICVVLPVLLLAALWVAGGSGRNQKPIPQ